jgi:hypothetical protein
VALALQHLAKKMVIFQPDDQPDNQATCSNLAILCSSCERL